MRTRVKICGITNLGAAQAAVDAGADALGFMFHDQSPRRISTSSAARIIRELPPFISRVGVFVNAMEETVRATLSECGLDTLQFHGEESPEFCAKFSPTMVYKAFRIQDAESLKTLSSYKTAGWLLDSYSPAARGGTGEAFQWNLAVEAGTLGTPIILAGGLRPENVAEAIRTVRPYAVDVSSGVEDQPGEKSTEKMRRFVEAIREASR